MSKLLFTINEYLAEIKTRNGGADVPEKQELADVLGLHPASFSRLASNKTRGPNREQVETLLNEFRRRGFDTKPCDLLRYYPPD